MYTQTQYYRSSFNSTNPLLIRIVVITVFNFVVSIFEYVINCIQVSLIDTFKLNYLYTLLFEYTAKFAHMNGHWKAYNFNDDTKCYRGEFWYTSTYQFFSGMTLFDFRIIQRRWDYKLSVKQWNTSWSIRIDLLLVGWKSQWESLKYQ